MIGEKRINSVLSHLFASNKHLQSTRSIQITNNSSIISIFRNNTTSSYGRSKYKKVYEPKRLLMNSTDGCISNKQYLYQQRTFSQANTPWNMKKDTPDEESVKEVGELHEEFFQKYEFVGEMLRGGLESDPVDTSLLFQYLNVFSKVGRICVVVDMLSRELGSDTYDLVNRFLNKVEMIEGVEFLLLVQIREDVLDFLRCLKNLRKNENVINSHVESLSDENVMDIETSLLRMLHLNKDSLNTLESRKFTNLIVSIASSKKVSLVESRMLEIEGELKELLKRYYLKGLSSEVLKHKVLDWNEESPHLFETVLRYERVHPMHNWNDLRERVKGYNKRMYFLYHHLLPKRPLAFIHVTFSPRIPTSIHEILTHNKKQIKTETTISETSKVAVFYSISSIVGGLRGIDLGNFLIKSVVGAIGREAIIQNENQNIIDVEKNLKWIAEKSGSDFKETDLTQISTYCTLSPIPLFRHLIELKIKKDEIILREQHVKFIRKVLKYEDKDISHSSLLKSVLEAYEQDLLKSKDIEVEFEQFMKELCLDYISNEKKNTRGIDYCYDPVANFHLRNGAILEQINFQANMNHRGMKESYGMMVNYKYVMKEVKKNSSEYIKTGKVKASETILNKQVN